MPIFTTQPYLHHTRIYKIDIYKEKSPKLPNFNIIKLLIFIEKLQESALIRLGQFNVSQFQRKHL